MHRPNVRLDPYACRTEAFKDPDEKLYSVHVFQSPWCPTNPPNGSSKEISIDVDGGDSIRLAVLIVTKYDI